MNKFAAMLNFFDAGSPFLDHPLLTAERTAQEIDFIEEKLAVGPGARILDVGCGFGRHSIELARRGYQVTGIDSSPNMIAESQQRAKEAGVRVDFHLARADQFVSDQTFDGAICLFTSLGQITDHGENSGLVDQVALAVKEGARFIVEVPQRETAVNRLKIQESFAGKKRTTLVHRHFDAQTHVISENFRIVDKAEQRTYLLKVRLFDRLELETLLAEAGFTMLSAHGDYQGTLLGKEHPNMLLVACKDS